jgi:hypothetical protein
MFSAAPAKQTFGRPTPLFSSRFLPTLACISAPTFFRTPQNLEKYNQEILF